MRSWSVQRSRKVAKQLGKLPKKVEEAIVLLEKEIETSGPVRGNWPNYSRLEKQRHHCHLNKRGRPTYIACWEVVDKKIKLVEIYHVSTREKAPY